MVLNEPRRSESVRALSKGGRLLPPLLARLIPNRAILVASGLPRSARNAGTEPECRLRPGADIKLRIGRRGRDLGHSWTWLRHAVNIQNWQHTCAREALVRL